MDVISSLESRRFFTIDVNPYWFLFFRVLFVNFLAKKYNVPALEKACVDFLKRNLSSENAFMLLTQALLFEEKNLGEMCLEMIDRNTLEALSAEGAFLTVFGVFYRFFSFVFEKYFQRTFFNLFI